MPNPQFHKKKKKKKYWLRKGSDGCVEDSIMNVEITLCEHEIKTIFWLAGFVNPTDDDYKNQEVVGHAIKTAIENLKP